MRKGFINGLMTGVGFLSIVIVGIAIAFAADILTVDKDGTVRLRVSDKGKVTINASEAAEGDLRFTPRTADPTAPLAGDLWFNSADRQIKYSDISGKVKPLAQMTSGALTLYANGAQADDSGDGLSLATAKKYIQSAVNLIPPVVNHTVTINVSAGVYRDAGATGINVYIADKHVGASGSIVIIGDETTPANVRVTGSDSGADTTPVRSSGFKIYCVKNVDIRGFLCNYFTTAGIWYFGYAMGSPKNCVCSNNTLSGILFDLYSRGDPNTCTTNSNQYGLLVNTSSSVNPTSCTANSNTVHGFLIQYNSVANLTSCTANSNYNNGVTVVLSSTVNVFNSFTSLNGTTGSGWGYGIYYSQNSNSGNVSNCASPGGNNQSGGVRAEYGSRVNYTDPTPNANNRTADATSQVW